jgi:cell division protein FtsI (penicillin-binding protein 3)
VFPTDGPLNAPRYFVLIMMDEPHPTKDTFGFATGAWNAAPTAGHVINRIAPFLGVERVEPVLAQANAPASGAPASSAPADVLSVDEH